MERGSAQHGSRVDDELAHEAEAVVHGSIVPGRDREELEPEALTADEQVPMPETTPSDSGPAVPTHAQIVARSELARFLLPSAFPANAATLAGVARGQDAPDDAVTALDALPSGQVFETLGELWVAFGGETEHRPTPPAPPPTPDVTPPRGDSLADLVTLPARVALGALRLVAHTIGRGISSIAVSRQSS